MSSVEFFLGAHQPGWLSHVGVPLFVSDARLQGYKTLPRAQAPWALDSRGFNMLQQHGRWIVGPEEYVGRVRRYRDEIGQLRWAAPQDWMCEPPIIYGGQVGPQRFVGTRQFLDPDNRLSYDQLVLEHQRRTVLNRVELRALDPSLPIIDVVQGWEPWQYVRCVDLYWELAGIDLAAAPLVGVGSICRRQNTTAAGEILAALRDRGLTRLHTFGFAIPGLRRYRHLAFSADSMAGSATARLHALRAPKLGLPHGLMPGCTPGPHHPAKNCANCLPYALRWRADAIAAAEGAPPRRPLRQPRHVAGQLPLWATEQETGVA